MKVLTGKQMAELDEYVTEKIGIPNLVLMENAGAAFVRVLHERFSPLRSRRFVVVCGPGNNGGDGLVVSRRLMDAGAAVQSFLVGREGSLSSATAHQIRVLRRLKIPVRFIATEGNVRELRAALEPADIVVDALFGTGFRGAPRELPARVIELLVRSREKGKTVVALDIPSGVEADTGQVRGACVDADVTVTFALPKLGLLLYPGRAHAGAWEVVDIGYPKAAIDQVKTDCCWVELALVERALPPRTPYSHKGDYGKVLVIAGSRGLTGAAALTAQAATRSGAGLVYLGIPESLLSAMEAKLTEIVKIPLPEEEGAIAPAAQPIIERAIRDRAIDVLAVGPGLSPGPSVRRWLTLLIDALCKSSKRSVRALVLDADGLNVLSEGGAWRKLAESKVPVVLTPHPGELSRLLNRSVEEIEADRVGIAREIAQQLQATLVLKGVPTVTARPDGHVFLNSTGNSGLASGGSGDVLTGLIAGLTAQGMEPSIAAVCGVYLHGLIADRLKRRLGERAMIASDLIEFMPFVLREL